MSAKREPFDRKRGRHRKRASAETRTWEAEHLMPKCPPWLPAETYQRLVRMRNG